MGSNASFIIGDYDDSDSDTEKPKVETAEAETQTDTSPAPLDGGSDQLTIEPRPPRALDECVSIMKSEVRKSD